MTTCHTCHRPLPIGTNAWADDWRVIDVTSGNVRTETRYTCDDCEAKR